MRRARAMRSMAAGLVAAALATAASAQATPNVGRFAVICASSVGFRDIDPTLCSDAVLGVADGDRKTPPTIASLFANALAGNRNARLVLQAGFTGGAPIPLVVLNRDPCDRFLADGDGGCTEALANGSNALWGSANTATLNGSLTDEQEALLGCGPLWGTDCEVDGIDLLKADWSVLLRPLVEPPPGLPPGARGPGAVGYAPRVDGCVSAEADPLCGAAQSLVQPLEAPQNTFESELAALSWNFLMTLVAMSAPTDGGPAIDEQFDPAQPYRTGEGMCSFAQPQFCASVVAFLAPEPSAMLAGATALGLLALARRRR